jgi:uncharacterized protein YjbI with pentapeptide repeats
MGIKRRLLSTGEAKRILGGRVARVVEDVEFPALEYGGHLRQLTLRNADMRAIIWTPTIFRRFRMEDSRFERVDLRNWDLRRRALQRLVFEECHFGDGWGGSDLRLTEVTLSNCRWDNVEMGRFSFLRCTLDLIARDVSLHNGTIAQTTISGSLKNANVRDIQFEDCDMSALRLSDVVFSRVSGGLTFPDAIDNFVVSSDALGEVIGTVGSSLSTAARIALDEIHRQSVDPEIPAMPLSVDALLSPTNGYAFSDIERREIIGALYPRRMHSLDHVTFTDAN